MDRLAAHVSGELSRLGVPTDATVIVACSGGPDSMVLAHIAATLRRAGRLGEVTLVYVDHGLRPDAADDGDRVARLAAACEVGFALERVTVPREASLEAAARRARYAALERAADRLRASAILLAHTANDQAETVLMRICRGTGIAGLAAMAPRRQRIVRPLLSIERPAISAYLRRHRLDPVADPMNADVRFSRVRWRTQWLPALEHENPRIVSALCRIADSAREPREILDFAAGALLDKAAGDGLDTAALREAPQPVLARALAVAAERAGGAPLTHRHLDALIDLVRAPEAGTRTLDLPELTAARVYDRLHFSPAGAHEEPAPPWQVKPDPDVQGTFRARFWQPGDRMRPARLRGHSRKLSDLYTDLKIPRAQRPRALVLEKLPEAEIVWAEHIGTAYGQLIEVTLTPPCVVVRNKA